jgi:hypothetical protein
MSEPKPPFFNRLVLAFQAFWHTLNDPSFAIQLTRLTQGEPLTQKPPEPSQPTPATLKETLPEAALQLLALLQQEGRFVDFLQEDVKTFSDAEIGGAARVVHEGCCKALQEHLTLAPVRSEAEGTRLTLEEGFDAAAIRLTGNVVGTAPFSGALVHRGWRVVEIKLPKIAEGHDVTILAPAEVEL